MDTAKPLNPPKKDEAADDLIEELARLMADDAQTSTAGAKPSVAAPPPIDRSADNAGKSDAQPQGFSDSASGQAFFDASSISTVTKADEPAFEMKGFDLGAPKAEVTNLTSSPASAQTPDSSIADFDFGFGVGPDNGTSQQAQPATPAAPPSTPQPSKSGVQPGSDPIADLINAAVSKHTLPDIAPAPVSQQAAPQVIPSPNSATPVAGGTAQTGFGTKDKFESPPVFGLSGKPSVTPDTAPKTSGSAMALDEIESLIGNSVQVDTPADFNAQQAVENGARTGPALGKTPMAANIAPRSQLSSNQPGSADNLSAEGSILQAMSNSGAAAAKVKTFVPPTPGSKSNKAGTAAELSDTSADADDDMQLAAGRASFDEQQKGGLSRYVAPIVGILFIGAVGFGIYTLFNPGAGEGNAPVLRADGSPTREVPDAVETDTQSVVLNEIDGASPVAEGEQLVSRDQSAELNGTAIRQVETLDTSETGLANRRVRTVTVRPDGTIISGADAVAGGEVLNVAQPDLPDLPADAINTELSSTTVAALPENPASVLIPASGLNAGVESSASIATPNPTEAPTPRPRLTTRDALALVIANSEATSTVPQTTPGAVNLVNAAPSVPVTPATSATSVAPVAPATPAATPASNSLSQPVLNPGAFVQLASQRDEGVANRTAATLQSRFSSALHGGQLVVRRVNLGTRGIYYRVQLPTTTLAQANSICESIKGAGGDCFVRNS